MGEFKEKERLAIGKSTDRVHDNHADAADASASLQSLLVHGWARASIWWAEDFHMGFHPRAAGAASAHLGSSRRAPRALGARLNGHNCAPVLPFPS